MLSTRVFEEVIKLLDMLIFDNRRSLIAFSKELLPISLALIFFFKVGVLASIRGENVIFIIVLGYIAFFYAQRIINHVFPQFVLYTSFYFVLCFCFFEALRGIVQILSSFRLNSLVIPTGDFFYSGPYGGLLAVLISMLLGYHERISNLIDKYLIYVTIIISIIPLLVTGSRSSWVALIVVVFIYYHNNSNIGSIVHKYKWLLIFLPFLVCLLYFIKKPSADSRLFISKINMIALMNSGLDGNGPSTYPGVYGEYQTRYFLKKLGAIEETSNISIKDDCNKVVKSLINNYNPLVSSKITEKERLMSDCPDFAYNEFMKIGIEYGLLVLGLVIGLMSISLFELFDKQSFWKYGLTSIIVFSMFSFPLNYLSFRLLLIFLISQGYSSPGNRHKSLIIYESLVCIGIIGVVISHKHEVQMRDKSMQLWNSNLKWYKNGRYDYLLEDGDSIIEWYNNPSFLYCYSEALNQFGYYEKSDSVLSLCLKYNNKPQYYYLMGNNSIMKGDIENAEKNFSTAFMMVPNRLKPLYLLAKLYYDNNDICSFVKTANYIESFTPKIENEETQHLRQEIQSLIQNINIPINDYKE